MVNFSGEKNTIPFESAWRTLDNDLHAVIHPKTFLDSLISVSILKIPSTVVGLDAAKDSLLGIMVMRSQNRIFEKLSESEKLWVSANSGETQTWTQLLPLSHMDNSLTNYELAIFK